MNQTKLFVKLLMAGTLFTLIGLKLSAGRQSIPFEIVSDLGIVLILLGLGEGLLITMATLPMYLFFKTTGILKNKTYKK